MKKLFISFFAIVFLILTSASVEVHAQNTPSGTPTNNLLEQKCADYGKANWKFGDMLAHACAVYLGTDMNLQSHAKVLGDEFAYSTSDSITGSGCALATGDAKGCIGGSVVGMMNQTIADMYAHPPADTGMWIADVGHTLGFIPNQVYAQGKGIGFSGLTPLLPIWKAFRNIAYLLMAIVMMVLGFMIMFRKKIDPKTVVTAQNAIPRVVIALILITFSYAIVGVMIDVMYLLLYFAIALFSTVPNFPKTIDGRTASQFFSQAGLFDIMHSPVGAFDPYKILFGVNMGGTAGTLTADAGISIIAIGTALFSAPVAAGAALATLPYASMPLVHLIVSLAILFLFIRLLAFFLMTYVQIIISLIFAPIQLLAEALPGSEAFASWFKNLVSNLAVFPIAGIMFMLATMFSAMSSTGSGLNINPLSPSTSTLPTADTAGFWAPPFVSLNMHYLGYIPTNSNNMTAVTALLALGVLFAIPTVAGSVKEMLKAKPAVPMFDMGGAGGVAGQWLSSAYYIKSMLPSQFLQTLTGNKGHDDKHA